MLLRVFEWMGSLPVSVALGQSVWMFAVIQAFHLVALGIFAGAVLVVDLRLLGRGLIEQPVARLARDAQPWLIAAFLALVATGLPQLFQNALREYYSVFFWTKIALMAIALMFTFTVRRRVTLDDARVGRFWSKIVGLVSIALWLGVAVNARLIGLFT